MSSHGILTVLFMDESTRREARFDYMISHFSSHQD